MRRITIPILCFFTGALLLLSACGKAAEQPSEEYARIAKVSEVNGEATVFSGDVNDGLAAFKGMSLKQGDRVSTGSGASVTLKLDGGMEVVLSENTTVGMNELESFADSSSATIIKLDAGAVWADIKRKLETGSSFEIETPTAVMGVRGTKFSVVAGDKFSKVAVIEGKVEVSMETGVTGKDGKTTSQKLTAMVGKQEQLRVTRDIRSEEDFRIEPLTVDSMDPFTLGIVRELAKTQPSLLEGTLKEEMDNLSDDDTIGVEPSASETPTTEPAPEETPAVMLPEGYPGDAAPIIDGGRLFSAQLTDGVFAVALYSGKSLDEAFQFYENIMRYYDNYSSEMHEYGFSLTGERDGYYISVDGNMAGEEQTGVNLYIYVSEY